MNGKLALACIGGHQIKSYKVESVNENQIEKEKIKQYKKYWIIILSGKIWSNDNKDKFGEMYLFPLRRGGG